MSKEEFDKYISILLGKTRVMAAKREPTETEKFADKLIARNRADQARMTEQERVAGRIRGC
jgi:hypothetical protein